MKINLHHNTIESGNTSVGVTSAGSVITGNLKVDNIITFGNTRRSAYHHAAKHEFSIINATKQTAPANQSIYDMVYHPWLSGGAYIGGGNATGSGPYLITSHDGINWTQRSHGKNNYINSFVVSASTPSASIIIAAGGADGADTYLLTSTDAITWTERATLENRISYELIHMPNLSGGTIVSIGDYTSTTGGTYIMTSQNGYNWVNRSVSVGADLFDGVYVPWLSGGTLIVVGGSNPYQLRSTTDAVNWNILTHPGTSVLDGIACSDNKIIAVGYADGTDAYMITSTNGLTWTELSNPQNIRLNSITYADGYWLAVGDNDGTRPYVIGSHDGLSWVQINVPESTVGLNRATYDAGYWLLSGDQDGVETLILKSI